MILASIAGAVINATEFFQSYLVALVFWTGVSLGSLALMMVHHLSGGAWGLVIRRMLEAAARSIPVVAVFYVPVLLFGMRSLFEWMHEDVVARDAVLQQKAVYLNQGFFTLRWAVFFGVWSAMGYLLSKWSADQDQEATAGIITRFGRLSGPGIVFYGISLTFWAVDWVMSLSPHYFSTMWGFLFMADQGLSALAFTIVALSFVGRLQPLADVIQKNHLHDLGKLLFAFVMLHAYLAFSQFLITWSANLPEEIPWFIVRTTGGWGAVSLLLAFGHFVVPFAILLSATVKQNVKQVTLVAAWLLLMRMVDLLWTIQPNFHEGAFHISWMHVTTMLGLGGIWVAAYLTFLGARPMLPVNDPYLKEALATHGSH